MVLRSAKRVSARKSPALPGWLLLVLITAHAGEAVAQSADTTALFRDAKRAESEYESSIRRFAPVSFAAPRSDPCDEVVGRFCIYYESGGDSLPPEPAPIRAAREKAISRLAAAHAHAPERNSLAYPLVRFLEQAHRTAEALDVADRFARASRDRMAAYLLAGYALHVAGDTRAAAKQFDSWLTTMPAAQRERISDVGWLLDRKERSQYERLNESQKNEYQLRLWRWADPLYLTPGNEAWTDHAARHALARMLASRRGIPNIDMWGEDLEQLTVRFGAPAITTRSWRTGAIGSQEQYSEHWDPTLRTYVPPALDQALGLSARLDTVWPLDSMTARSGHAPPTIRVMRVLEHQAAVFADTIRMFVLSATARLDSAAANRPMNAAVFLMDSALQIIAQAPAVVISGSDSVVFSAALPLHPGARYYSAEIHDPESRWAARARYVIESPQGNDALTVSSIQLASPFDPGQLPADRKSRLLRPLLRPVVAAGARVGIYAEVSFRGLQRRNIHVQIEKSRLDQPGSVGKLIGWIGRKVGLSSTKTPARLGWSVEIMPGAPTALPVTLDLRGDEPGRYLMTLTVRDPETGASAVTRREMQLVKARGAGRP